MSTENLTIRIDPDLKERLKKIAEGQHRSLNKQVEKALKEWLDTHETIAYRFIPDLKEAEQAIEDGEIQPTWKGS